MQATLLTVLLGTTASVGYSDILAKTEAGKVIGSALMAYGPALAAHVFHPPNQARQRTTEAERSESALRGIAGSSSEFFWSCRPSAARRLPMAEVLALSFPSVVYTVLLGVGPRPRRRRPGGRPGPRR